MRNQLDVMMNMAHMNLRREKAGEDEGPVAADLKLTAEIGVDALKGLFSTKNAFDTVMGAMWTAKGELATSDVDTITVARELTGCKVTLKAGDHGTAEDFDSGEVNKIRIKPLAGKCCELTIRLQVHPSDEQVAWLAEHYGYDLRVTVAQRQQSLDLQAGASAGAEAAVH